MHAFGAQFVEVRVDADTGEMRVPRLLGVFAAGRIINPQHRPLAAARRHDAWGCRWRCTSTASWTTRFGHVVNQDLAEYHIAANADVGDLEVHWLDEQDPHVNAMGTKGIGEIGIVGAAAAIANAVYHATGVRVRDLPITPDRLVQ